MFLVYFQGIQLHTLTPSYLVNHNSLHHGAVPGQVLIQAAPQRPITQHKQVALLLPTPMLLHQQALKPQAALPIPLLPLLLDPQQGLGLDQQTLHL